MSGTVFVLFQSDRLVVQGLDNFASLMFEIGHGHFPLGKETEECFKPEFPVFDEWIGGRGVQYEKAPKRRVSGYEECVSI